MKSIQKCLLLGCLGLSILALTAGAEERRKVKGEPAKPVYPEVAKRFRLSGTVKIEVTITPAGTVRSTKVIGGHPLLAEAALDAVKRWKYESATEETVQVESLAFTQ